MTEGDLEFQAGFICLILFSDVFFEIPLFGPFFGFLSLSILLDCCLYALFVWFSWFVLDSHVSFYLISEQRKCFALTV